jgi:transposase-like protein
VNDRWEGWRFSSAILPPWARRSPKVSEVLPVLYLRGVSTKDFVPALAEFFGSEAGLSASTVQRLTREWSQGLDAFRRRDLSQVDYVYLWADGVHFNIRLEEDRLCCLVLVGVRADGRKELIAVGDGYRESEDSWAEVLRDLKRRGMRAPVLAVGDGALGFWPRSGRSSRRPGSSAAGCTRSRGCWTRCRRACNRRPRRRCTRS